MSKMVQNSKSIEMAQKVKIYWLIWLILTFSNIFDWIQPHFYQFRSRRLNSDTFDLFCRDNMDCNNEFRSKIWLKTIWIQFQLKFELKLIQSPKLTICEGYKKLKKIAQLVVEVWFIFSKLLQYIIYNFGIESHSYKW